ncbi:MAG: response regulator [Steroidobacteraceae bacterium]
MSAEPVTTRMAVLARALPKRILLVDDDELERELMADRLQSAGFEVPAAAHGSEALAILERQWFPLLITDWEMPELTGIELTERLRARGVSDTYVVMLTVRDAGVDYERGYHAGVDDYLTKKLPDAELLTRVQKGFATLTMRRSLKDAHTQLASRGQIDPQSGAFNHGHLLTSLQSECKRAERCGRNLSLMTVAVEMKNGGTEVNTDLGSELLHQVVDALGSVIRAHVDWIARVDAAGPAAVFAIVLPEAGAVDAAMIKNRLQNALRALHEASRSESTPELQFTFGFAALDLGRVERRAVAAGDLLEVAEHCRNCLQSRGRSQLTTVQASVAHGVAICCRHGYAVESHCQFMGERVPAQFAEPPA